MNGVLVARLARLRAIQRSPALLAQLRVYYGSSRGLPDFVNDWGMTFDPRLPGASSVPFTLYPRQRDWLRWFCERVDLAEDGLTEKSRDLGLTWLAVSAVCTMCLFRQGQVFGFGSRKEILVDRVGDPDSIFWKARFFLEHLPSVFTGGWDAKKNSAHLRLDFPATGCVIRGEAGDNIGRGGRARAYITDEDAYIPRSSLVDAALSANTDCRIRISTPNGRANGFARRRFSGEINVFTFRWSDHPRKDVAWYARQCARLDPVTMAREHDIDYDSSVRGQLLPIEWLRACIDAHDALGFAAAGARVGALDVADEGPDLNAFAVRHGVLLTHCEAWSGEGSDTAATTARAFALAKRFNVSSFVFDSDGLGACVRGDARMLRERTGTAIRAEPWRGSARVVDPDAGVVTLDGSDAEALDDSAGEFLTNADFFANAKAQAWWTLRTCVQRTWRAVQAANSGEPVIFDADDLISFSAGMPSLEALLAELSQPVFSATDAGKMVIEKTPAGTKSPNLADAVMMVFAPRSARRSVLDMYNDF